MKKPVFDSVIQISIVVDDLDAYMKRYNDDYGIGPWTIVKYDKSNANRMTVRGESRDFAIRLALCDCLNVQWELIQPMEENGPFAEFLKTRGPGIHHLCIEPAEGYAKTREFLAGRGYAEALVGGFNAGNREFAYMDLTSDLGFVLEIVNPPEGYVKPPPEGYYPPKDE